MNKTKATVAIYGIQDKTNSLYPTISHDHNIAVFSNGCLIKYLHLERLTGKKFDNSIPKLLYPILKDVGLLKIENFDLVFVDNVLGRSFINIQGNIRFEAPLVNNVQESIESGKCYFLDKQIDAYILNHELAHIFSCIPFYGNFKENSLLVHFDGGASLSNFSVWTYCDGYIKKIDANWELAYLSSIFNSNALVFSILGADIKEQNSVAGKFMGFASFGDYDATIEKWLIKNDYFKNIWKKKSVFFSSAKKEFGVELKSFNQKDKFIQDVAATLHHIFVRETIDYLKNLKQKTNTKYLYYTGGSALNIIVNTELVSRKIFEDVYIPPCTNDSGLALGAGVCLEIMKGNKVNLVGPYINNWGIENYQIDYTVDDIIEVTGLLTQGKVIGVCNNYGEAGPRALGNRSILALANSKRLAKAVSEDIKKREWYRPVAPIMLEKNVKYYTGNSDINHLSRFMLIEFPITKDKINEIEGVVHIDGTSRIQTIFNREQNEYIYDLLLYMDDNFGTKALINTSFNKQGSPIVHTTEDAVSQAKIMKLDAVVLNGKLMKLKS